MNSASITLAAPLSAACGSPRSEAVRPGPLARSRYSARIASDERVSAVLSSQVTVSASRPFMAAQVSRAITATPVGTWTTSSTPATFRAAAASKPFTVAPKRGARATTAVTWFGRRMSRE